MDEAEFVEKLKTDRKFLRTVIRKFFRTQSLAMVALSFGLPEDTFDKIFINDPEFEEEFSLKVKEEFDKIQEVVAWPQISHALKTLANAANSDEASKAIAAASALIRAHQVILAIAREKEKEVDEIDQLWEELKGGSKKI